MFWRLRCLTALAMCGFLTLSVESALAEDKTVKVEQEWKGGSDEEKDNEAWKHVPPGGVTAEDGVIAGPKAWAKLWKAWKFEKELPKVDFEKDLILVVSCEGPNSIRIDKLSLSEKGSLRFDWSHTDKGGPGFRYLIVRVSRSGIKTVNDKEIPEGNTARGADEKDTGTKLALSSGYGHGLPGTRARSVHLSVTLHDKGEGKGTLNLDPNSLGIDQFGDSTGKSTLLPPQALKVTLEEVKFKDQPKGGRRLFEVKGHGLDNRLFLAIPRKGSTTYRLVTVDKEGNGLDVLLLEPAASSGK
jgi:hypothetical protein